MIEKSLQLLHTDHVDLWQLHDIGIQANVDQIFAKGGAMEALLEMQQQKVVRFLGVTGHFRPDVLIECLRRHPFDTILMAMNAADPHHFSFNQELLPLAVERQMGIIGMKIPARGRILSTGRRRPPTSKANNPLGRVRPRRRAHSPFARPCTTRSRARSARSSSAATPSRNWKRTCYWHASLRPQRQPNSGACEASRAGRKAVSLLPLLRPHIGAERQVSAKRTSAPGHVIGTWDDPACQKVSDPPQVAKEVSPIAVHRSHCGRVAFSSPGSPTSGLCSLGWK